MVQFRQDDARRSGRRRIQPRAVGISEAEAEAGAVPAARHEGIGGGRLLRPEDDKCGPPLRVRVRAGVP